MLSNDNDQILNETKRTVKVKYKKSERKMKLQYIPQEIRATQAANTNNFIMMICIKDDFMNR